MYYNDPDKVLMTDVKFDIIKEFLYRTYPKSVMLKEVGAPISTANKNKVVLPYNMPSMDKIKPSTDALKKWLAKDNSNQRSMFCQQNWMELVECLFQKMVKRIFTHEAMEK